MTTQPTARSPLWARHRRSVIQFLKFGMVGGSGVLVNMLVAIICNKIGPTDTGPVWPIPFTDFNIRWYHVYAMIAFLVANVWNFQLNRWWTFKSHLHATWFREYPSFLTVGLMGQLVSFIVLTLLMNTNSPVHLPRSFFDGSTGFRTPFYWAQLISILVAVPVTFIVNKLWTFRAVRSGRLHPAATAGPIVPVGTGDPTDPVAPIDPANPADQARTERTED